MDALSEVVKAARLSGGVFLHAEFREPWCVLDRLDASSCGPFLSPVSDLIHYHYVAEGRLKYQVEGEPEQVLRAGDVVLFPRNHQHLLGSDLALTPTQGDRLVRPPTGAGLAAISHGGEGARTRLVCGFLGSQGVAQNPVLSALPPAIRLTVGESGGAEWIRSTFQHAADEVAAGRPGSGTVLEKLSEILFIEAVRLYVENVPDEATGWLAGLKDPEVSRVLALIHGQYSRAWTVEDLGRAIGLSRSTLGERFARIMGIAPMQYLANWRMQVAAQRLRSSHDTLADIATGVGYESEAAFSRAFKKAHGRPPATWRRESQTDHATQGEP